MNKILLILRSLPYPISKDGLSVINYRLLKSFPVNYSIDIISLSKESQDTIQNIELFQTVNNILIFENKGIDCDLIRKQNLIKRSFGIDNIQYKNFLDKYHKNYDLIYYCVPPSALYCYIPKTKTPIFLNAVDSFSLLNKRLFKLNQNIVSKLKFILYKNLEKKIYKKANIVNFVSSIDENYTNQTLKINNTSTIPNGVEINLMDYSKRDESTLLFVGNFNNISNALSLQYFIREIWPFLHEADSDIRLKVVGPNLLEKYNVAGIDIVGYVDNVIEYYRKCTVFIAPLISGSGIKNKVLEAMALGIPVISSSIGLDGIEVRKGIDVIEANSFNEWISSIIDLIHNPSKREELAKNAFNVVRDKYDWNKNIQLYYQKFISLIDTAKK